MPTTLDCHIMKNVFGTNRMRAVFDSRRLLQGWLEVWAGLAEAEADAGLIPQCFILLDGALSLAHRILSDLQVDTERMTGNLAMTEGGIVAEAVMYGLGWKMGRGEAHELTMKVARQAHAEHKWLIDVMLENEEVRRHLSEAEMRELVNPQNYLGMAEAVEDRIVSRVSRRIQSTKRD